MHTPNSEIVEIQLPASGRRHTRYNDDFKRQVVVTCLERGVSEAVIALANRLTANILRRWVVESSKRNDCPLENVTTSVEPDHNNPRFIPVQLVPLPPPQTVVICIEPQHARTNIQIQ